MNDFRFLAIRPLNGTSSKFRKNLKKQVIYKFYQDILFKDRFGAEILKRNSNLSENEVFVLFPEKIPSAIYSTEKLNINVCAVVGQNGSGKSSLIDFYNLILYYLASHHYGTMDSTASEAETNLRYLALFVREYYSEIKSYFPTDDIFVIDISSKINELKEDELLDLCSNLASNLENRLVTPLRSFTTSESELALSKKLWRYYIDSREHYDIKIRHSMHQTEFVYAALNRSFSDKIKELIKIYQTEKQFNDKLKNKLNFQIFYHMAEQVHTIQKIGNIVSGLPEQMFYTILLNYSLHSMNSNNLGRWIHKLFHKNDGYQTPNVINPFRSEGNIDVNSELSLSTDRLVYNVIDQYRTSEHAVVLKKYSFKRFIFKLKKKNYYTLSELKIDYKNRETFLDFLSSYPRPFQFNLGPHTITDYCLGYLIKKFHKISSIYMNHFYVRPDFSHLDYEKSIEAVEKWQIEKAKEFLLQSDSHVAKKFNQTYNFLVNHDFWMSELDFLNSWDIEKEMHLTEEDLILWITKAKDKMGTEESATGDIITELFPAIFDIDIEFSNGKSIVKLSDLSSGEQQYIFNINTIIYHINNLKTVEPVQKSYIRKYDYVNIILDEVELYYHPEFQKKLVKDLLDEIGALDSLGDLVNFNILFLTHSPFILSDIPNQNILRLEDGRPSDREFMQTFGANIHDLLANDFFLKGFMGEFAKKFIKDLISEIEKVKDKELTEDLYNEFVDKINLIGEPVIKNSVRSLLDKQFEVNLILIKRREELTQELYAINKKIK
ncbi:hypothetical protein NLG42_19590 [Flavobacterium plurextorum]|uniref:hypothetical protein n=1 Tax=Flavobacterium TaxID=237 RepID=UPI00214DE474|nr:MULTISPECIES: hypothetical protein [Flavobacterium]UUW08298.1 hypothetical protein NLG42_19590 [Flavobacterium plurextorum]